MTTSCQPRPQPHSSGMAAISARNGTATKTPTRTRLSVDVGSSSNSERALVLVALPICPPVAGAVGDGAWTVVGAARRAGEVGTSAALTVSGEVGIVLLWIRRGRAGALARLRNRSLLHRRLRKAWQMNFCK